MPSFDITSEFNQQEVNNAIDQMNREIINRYDFKDTKTSVSFNNDTISLRSSSEERLNAADQVLREKFAKRKVSIKFLNDFSDEQTTSEAKREYILKSGLDKEISKIIVKDLKEFSKKIQSSIQDESIRVSSKKRDELQDAISFLKEKNYKVFLNYGNFRD
ncbi:MAG: YajQ family cyclic di-GMP-binding protein [Candidatus Actinomarinales bacterium]|nr:MAG: YajQ family cyclic di-GMP-binding protein [Candidatus Actinomarinales bacterium]